MATSDYLLSSDAAGVGFANVSEAIGSHILAAGDNRIVVALAAGENAESAIVTNISYNSDAQFTKAISASNANNMGVSLWYLLEADLPATPGTYPYRAYVATSTNNSAIYTGAWTLQNMMQEAPQNDTNAFTSNIDLVIDPITSDAIVVSIAGIQSSNYPGLSAGSDITTFQVQQLTSFLSTLWGAQQATSTDSLSVTYNSANAVANDLVAAMSMRTYKEPPVISGVSNNAILFSISI